MGTEIDKSLFKEIYFYNGEKDILYIEANGKHIQKQLRMDSLLPIKAYRFTDDNGETYGFRINNFSKLNYRMLSFYMMKIWNYDFTHKYLPFQLYKDYSKPYVICNQAIYDSYETTPLDENEYLLKITYKDNDKEYLKGYIIKNMKLGKPDDMFKLIRKDSAKVLHYEFMNYLKFFKCFY